MCERGLRGGTCLPIEGDQGDHGFYTPELLGSLCVRACVENDITVTRGHVFLPSRRR